MPIIAKGSDLDFTKELMPTGTQQAVCVFVEDIGTHEGEYQGKQYSARKIIICWELREKMKLEENAGKPFMVSKWYTLSLNSKATLRKDLESWRGKAFTPDELKGFDVEKLKGVNCLLNIISGEKADGTETRKIASISTAMAGMEKLVPINQEPPAWIQKEREKSIEYQEAKDKDEETMAETTNPEEYDDLPF